MRIQLPVEVIAVVPTAIVHPAPYRDNIADYMYGDKYEPGNYIQQVGRGTRINNQFFTGKRYKRRSKKPTLVIHHSASGQSITWEGEKYDFTNTNNDTLSFLASNVCSVVRI